MAKIEISKNGYLQILQRALECKEEERDLALDRYRRQDNQMKTEDDFVLQGRNAVAFLNAASDSSNQFLKIATEIKSIVYKEDVAPTTDQGLGDDFKKGVEELIRGMNK